MKPMKTRYWIVLFAGLLAAGIFLTVFLFNRRPSGTVANVYRDGVCIWSVDLSRVDEPFEKVISDDSGSNTLYVERGRLRVCDADCPDRVCVNAGWLSESTVPIVCLPHRIVIRMEKAVKSNGGTGDAGNDAAGNGAAGIDAVVG